MFIAALCMIGPNWKGQMSSYRRVDTIECSLTIKTNQLLTHARAWMNFRDIMMSKRCQTAKNTYCVDVIYIEFKNRKNKFKVTADQCFWARTGGIDGDGGHEGAF